MYSWRGNKYFDGHFQLIRPAHLLSKTADDAASEEGIAGKCVYFPPESAFFCLIIVIEVLLHTLYFDSACEQKFSPPLKKV